MVNGWKMMCNANMFWWGFLTGPNHHEIRDRQQSRTGFNKEDRPRLAKQLFFVSCGKNFHLTMTAHSKPFLKRSLFCLATNKIQISPRPYHQEGPKCVCLGGDETRGCKKKCRFASFARLTSFLKWEIPQTMGHNDLDKLGYPHFKETSLWVEDQAC